MKVHELIELLKAQNPDALVVINDDPVMDGDADLMEGAMQDIVSIEVGWSDSAIQWDKSFSPKEVPGYLVPAVRLLGYNNEPTDPNMELSINGVEQVG